MPTPAPLQWPRRSPSLKTSPTQGTATVRGCPRLWTWGQHRGVYGVGRKHSNRKRQGKEPSASDSQVNRKLLGCSVDCAKASSFRRHDPTSPRKSEVRNVTFATTPSQAYSRPTLGGVLPSSFGPVFDNLHNKSLASLVFPSSMNSAESRVCLRSQLEWLQVLYHLDRFARNMASRQGHMAKVQ